MSQGAIHKQKTISKGALLPGTRPAAKKASIREKIHQRKRRTTLRKRGMGTARMAEKIPRASLGGETTKPQKKQCLREREQTS